MPEQLLLRMPAAARQTRPPCCLARAHNAHATRRPHDGTAHCRRHHAVPPTAEPPPCCSLPAARRPASLSLPCDDFHTALATLAHRRRLPHAVAQHYAVPPLAVPPPCSHHCAQARQPRCRVTRIVNSAVISATPRCTPTPASCPATVATIDGGRLEPRAAAAPPAYKRQGRVALHRHDELSPSHPTPPALLALLLHKETSLLSISSCRQPRTKVSSCRAAPQHPRPSPTSAPSSARHQRAHKPRPWLPRGRTRLAPSMLEAIKPEPPRPPLSPRVFSFTYSSPSCRTASWRSSVCLPWWPGVRSRKH